MVFSHSNRKVTKTLPRGESPLSPHPSTSLPQAYFLPQWCSRTFPVMICTRYIHINAYIHTYMEYSCVPLLLNYHKFKKYRSFSFANIYQTYGKVPSTK